MTNNPTIDGVSRELLERAILAIRNTSQMHPTLEDLRALLDAPVVERQAPPIEVARYRLKAALPGLDGRLINRPEVVIAQAYDALQSTIAQLQAEKELMLRGAEVYKERIAELESGRGEPVAWVECSPAWLKAGGECATAPRLCVGRYGVSHLHPAHTAPSAPVAVVLPERKTFSPPSYRDQFAEGWNACLNATAALNK